MTEHPIPRPALVTERAAKPLPRWILWLFCAAYVLPGLLGRSPWKNGDLVAFGYMDALMQGWSPWGSPVLAGMPAQGGVFPYWLGAWSMQWLGPWIGHPLAARLPFALLLWGVLAFTWRATYHLARRSAAQPLPFAFGGEASPLAYGRSLADASVLALMACLGLVQLGHETTPELVQLFAVTALIYGHARAVTEVERTHQWQARLALLAAPVLLAGSGAPLLAPMASLGAWAWLHRRTEPTRALRAFAVAGGLASLAVGMLLHWPSRPMAWPDGLMPLLKQWVWFCWPVWPLALWTLWQWRRHILEPHVMVPACSALAAWVTSLLLGGSDRALMLALPALAILAAFALPTIRRGWASAMDWFSVLFLSTCAISIWVIYLAMQTGWPRQPAQNVQKLFPGFQAEFGPIALGVALSATAVWVALIVWRVSRHREVLWRSLVIGASGISLCWLLMTTLWLPLMNHARSFDTLVQPLTAAMPQARSLRLLGKDLTLVSALQGQGGWKTETVDSLSCDGTPAAQGAVEHALVPERRWLARDLELPGASACWTAVLTVQRAADRKERWVLLRQATGR